VPAPTDPTLNDTAADSTLTAPTRTGRRSA
jgi:hypothetical protein